MNLDLDYYIFRFFRRIHIFLLIVIVFTAGGVIKALMTEPVYRAEARLLVEAPQIVGTPETLATASSESEALVIIQQRIMARSNLLDMANRFNLYPHDAEVKEDSIVKGMRDRAEIRLPPRGSDAAILSVSFESDSRDVSVQVVNDMVEQILQENVALRTATTSETRKFFEDEVKRLDLELAKLGGQILDFKNSNKDALPDSLEFRRSQQVALQERIVQLERDLAGFRDRRARLVELYQNTGQTESSTSSLSPEEAQLRTLRQELATAMTTYSPESAQVTVLKGRVAALEKLLTESPESGTRTTGRMTTYQLQLADLDGQISFAEKQMGEIDKSLETIKNSIDATPGIATALDAMQRDYDNLQAQYNEAVGRLAKAATGDRIEGLSKGQRITVIEPATPPLYPISARRAVVALGFAGFGVAAGAALIFLLDLLSSRIMRTADLESGLGIAAFGAVPYIWTHQDIRRWRLMVFGLLAGLMVLVCASVLALHVYYKPFDFLLGVVPGAN
jgi:polysaccharide biosynthesis transport protein